MLAENDSVLVAVMNAGAGVAEVWDYSTRKVVKVRVTEPLVMVGGVLHVRGWVVMVKGPHHAWVKFGDDSLALCAPKPDATC